MKRPDINVDSNTTPMADAPGPPPQLAFRPEDSLPHAFAVATSRVSAVLYQMYSERFGLSVVGWRIVAILGSHSPLSAKALAELTAMDQVSISRALDLLVGKKLVSRRVDSADRRRVVLRLSKGGEDVYNQIVPLLQAADVALTSCLSDQDAATLRRLMKIVLDHSATVIPEAGNWSSLLAEFGPGPKPESDG